jgi:hypothetical protein
VIGMHDLGILPAFNLLIILMFSNMSFTSSTVIVLSIYPKPRNYCRVLCDARNLNLNKFVID